MEQASIAIMVQNIIQWYSIRDLASFLKKQAKIHLDIYLYDPKTSTHGFHNIASDTHNAIIKDGFTPITKRNNTKYKICLAPYSNMINLDCQYKLGFCYGAATTKPRFTLNPSVKDGFHGLFLHDIYGAELFSIYGKTYIVPDLYLKPIKQKKQNKKPVVLFLPTYHEPSTIQTITSLKELKDQFYIISKTHHGTENLSDEKDKQNLLSKISDETYTSSYPIKKLFEKCDVVLSDNSGAVMDALYANVPVAISAMDINQNLAGINTIQFELAKNNVIPYTNTPSPSTINQILKKALSRKQQKNQQKASDSIFPTKIGGAECWYKIIHSYLIDDVDQNYCKIHDYVFNRYNQLENENYQLINDISKLKTYIDSLESSLNTYKNSRAHQLVNKIQHLIYKSE